MHFTNNKNDFGSSLGNIHVGFLNKCLRDIFCVGIINGLHKWKKKKEGYSGFTLNFGSNLWVCQITKKNLRLTMTVCWKLCCMAANIKAMRQYKSYDPIAEVRNNYATLMVYLNNITGSKCSSHIVIFLHIQWVDVKKIHWQCHSLFVQNYL